MSFDEALKLLNLKYNYTEEELKKAYRDKIRKYHPDLASKENKQYAEEMSKKINEAHEILKNRTGYKQTTNSYTGVNLYEYKQKKRKELKDFIEIDSKLTNEKTFDSLVRTIGQVESYWFFYISSARSPVGVDLAFNNAKRKIKYMLEATKELFYAHYFIDEKTAPTLNYDLAVEDFLLELLKIKNRNSKIVIFQKRVEDETAEYISFTGYNKVKEVIEQIKKNIIAKARTYAVNNPDKLIDEMHKDIRKSFDDYFKYKKEIEDLKDTVNKLNNNFIRDEYNRLLVNFNNGASLSDIERQLNKLKKMIEEGERGRSNNQSLNLLLNKEFEYLYKRYQSSIKKAHEEKDSEKFYLIAAEYSKLAEMLHRIFSGELSIDDLNYIHDYEFGSNAIEAIEQKKKEKRR